MKIAKATKIMLAFLITLLFLAIRVGLDPIDLLNDALIKFSMSGILVLSLVPMMRVGAGLNFGLPIGVTSGLLGMCIAINASLKGFPGFLASVILALLCGCIAGIIYGKILNSAKGREEIAGVFVGYAFIPLMSIFWTLVPFTNRKMLYPVGGQGLRPRIGLEPFFSGVLNGSLEWHIGDIVVPVGLLLFLALFLLIVMLFYRTSYGKTFTLVGENTNYAEIIGIPVDSRRIFSVIFSTALAAIGICVYAQSYGFIELYGGAQSMTFPAVCALLIGGAQPRNTRTAHALIGVAIYQTMYLLSTPVANAYLASEITELFRMLVTNGVILFAFLQK